MRPCGVVLEEPLVVVTRVRDPFPLKTGTHWTFSPGYPLTLHTKRIETDLFTERAPLPLPTVLFPSFLWPNSQRTLEWKESREAVCSI